MDDSAVALLQKSRQGGQPAPTQGSPAEELNRQAIMKLADYDYMGAAALWKQVLAIDPNHLQAKVGMSHLQQIFNQTPKTGQAGSDQQRGYR